MRERRARRGLPGISLRAFQGLLILGLAAGVFGALLAYNARPVQSFDPPAFPVASATPTSSNWQAAIAAAFLLNATPIPTADASAVTYAPPTPWWSVAATPQVFAPVQIAGVQGARVTPTPLSSPTATPTGPSPTPSATPPAPLATATRANDWNPPPIAAPLSLDPRDHFWLLRPINSDRINYGLVWYHYGSDGLENNMRVHRGEDFSNPRGVSVLAAGDGTIIWADNGITSTRRDGTLEQITSYGNVMVIEHDFSFRGQPVYTLYAHLSAFTRAVGEHVRAGDIIALVGATGQVGGPHLHFEVRIGWNSYRETRNPGLWIMPYVGTGVIAGRVVDASGAMLADNLVELVDARTRKVIRRHTTYGPGAIPDEGWNENFLFPDVDAGEYEVVTQVNNERIRERVTVIPGVTSFVELVGTGQVPPATPQDVVP